MKEPEELFGAEMLLFGESNGRLEGRRHLILEYAREDRRKVLVCITDKGSTLVRRIRGEMVDNLMKLMSHLTPDEQKAWLQIYTKIYSYCQNK